MKRSRFTQTQIISILKGADVRAQIKQLGRKHGISDTTYYNWKSKCGGTYFPDEVFVKIRGKQHYLWRAVDQGGEVIDGCLKERRAAKAAKRFFKRFLKAGGKPGEIVTDKLRSYGVAGRSLISRTRHNTQR